MDSVLDGRVVVPIRFGPPLALAPDPAVLGFKAYNLLRMSRLGLPVPHAIVLGTGYCRDYLKSPAGLPPSLRSELEVHLKGLEQATGLRFGSTRKPLLVSIRSGAATSMPGMLDTVLNIGLCDSTLPGLLRQTGNPRLAWDSYRRLIQSFAEVVEGCGSAPFDELLARHLRRFDATDVRELDFHALQELAGASLGVFESCVGRPFPQQPFEQLERSIGAVFASWNSIKAREYRALHEIDSSAGTAVTIQRMIYGNAGGTSGAGVAFSRNPATGAPELYLDFLFNAQGDDVVSGRQRAGDDEALAFLLPDIYEDVAHHAAVLEREFGDAQEFEFTIQEGRLFILQTRSAKRTDWAALRIAVDLVEEGVIEEGDGLRLLRGVDLACIENQIVASSDPPLAAGVGAGRGVAVGPVAFDVTSVKRLDQRGMPAIFVRETPATEDIAGIARCAGLLCASGGRTSHAAVVARQLNRPCVVACDPMVIDAQRRVVRIGPRQFAEGETLSIDGSTGAVYAGEVEVRRERPLQWLGRVREWRSRHEEANQPSVQSRPDLVA